MQKKRILFVMGRLGVNGATRSLLALLEALPKDAYDISLFVCLQDNLDTIKMLPDSVKVLPGILEYEINRLPLRKALIKGFRLRRLDLLFLRLRVAISRFLKEKDYPCWGKLPMIGGGWDVAISYADGWLSSMVVNKVIARNKVLWVHEDYEHDMKPSEVLNSFLSADAIAGVSNDAIQHLRNIVGHEIDGKTHVVHNIIDPVKVQQQSTCEEVALQGKGCSLISVGRLSREKGYDLIPAILELLVKEKLDVCWYIIGDGPESYKTEILTDAKKRGVSDRIYFLGARSNPHPYTRRADCFVQLSQHEGWCMTITEALALGKPVVARDMPVFREQILDGANGFLANGIESFAATIQRVLRGELLPAQHILDSPCTPEAVKREFEKLMCEICE